MTAEREKENKIVLTVRLQVAGVRTLFLRRSARHMLPPRCVAADDLPEECTCDGWHLRITDSLAGRLAGWLAGWLAGR